MTFTNHSHFPRNYGSKLCIHSPRSRYVPEAHEVLGSVDEKIVLDNVEYVYVTDGTLGVTTLVIGPQRYTPVPTDTVSAVRHAERVAEYETVVVVTQQGEFVYQHGLTDNTTQLGDGQASTGGLAFYPPPHSEVQTFQWTIGGDVEQHGGTRTVRAIDTRIQQLQFEFDDIRTSDNIEFELEGVVFWQVTNVETLVRTTADPTLDIWTWLRSRFAKAASSLPYSEFLGQTSNITTFVQRALDEEASMFDVRGILIHNMELIEVELADEALEASFVTSVSNSAADRLHQVEQITTANQVAMAESLGAQEVALLLQENERTLETERSTNAFLAHEHEAELRMTIQQSEHTIEMMRLNASLHLELRRVDLLAAETANSRVLAASAGANKGVEEGNAAAEYLASLSAELPDPAQRAELYSSHEDRASRDKTTANLASGTAQLFLTPDEANLNLGGQCGLAAVGGG